MALGALALAFSFNVIFAKTAVAEPVCERQMVVAAAKYDVPLGILYAVGLNETGRGDGLRPYALNIEGQAVYDIDKRRAIQLFKEAQAKGKRSIDVGCMQINHRYHREHFASIEMMLDPAANVDYGARFLKELRDREGNWTMAIARYHAGPDNDAAQKRYVCLALKNIIATGFGAWTAQSRELCKPAG